MAEPMRLAIAVLAAGASRRFGEADKLTAVLRSTPLGLHVTDTLGAQRRALRADTLVVVTSRSDHPCASGWERAGFTVVKNPEADDGMGTSVAVAARIARRGGADALMIALADMPLVPREHYCSIIDAATQADTMIASRDGSIRMPPAVFGRAHFDALAQLSGDTGARALLREARTITCPPEWLTDIDTPEALAALQ